MKDPVEPLHAIPTNIISGFLGVGKTTAILSLLAAKPENERWAILVNEFGEIGIDGGLYEAQQHRQQGVFIREVPGGCMCCTSGLPMQIALNQLLATARPQRLLIEPTGLGHPQEILAVLSEPHYREVLDIQKCITLIDARKLGNPRYTEHEVFNQQIDIADVVVGNKQDLYSDLEKQQLTDYVAQRKGDDVAIVFTEQGKLDPALLAGPSAFVTRMTQPAHHHHPVSGININEVAIPDIGFLKIENSGEGFKSIGWRFAKENIFRRQALHSWIGGLIVERMKAVMITDEGVFGYNLVDNVVTEIELDEFHESRLEIIAQQCNSQWEAGLFACIDYMGK